MLEVAVIGAGTSGLVAARHLIHAGLRPTIFEAAKTVGGAWTPSSSSAINLPTATNNNNSNNDRDEKHHPHHPASKMWNGMTTNLSKYTCRFSDWPWPEDASTFPSVEEMNAYLTSYSDSFLTSSPSCNFQLECQVTNVEQLEPPTSEVNYKVEWIDLQTQTTHSRDFRGVVVATGFFHCPQLPSFLQKSHRDSFDDIVNNEENRPRIIHSSSYQTHQSFKNQNVAIVGASFSALEIAADVSKSAARVVHILPHVPWVIPRWVPKLQPVQSEQSKEASSPPTSSLSPTDDATTTMTILPVDLALYQRKQPYPQMPETVSMTPESCHEGHQELQSIVGHKQLHSPLGEPSNWKEPPFVVISDEYLDLVREGKIEVVHGRLAEVEEDGRLKIHPTETSSGNEGFPSTIDGIDHVISCTGYAPNLDHVLSSKILSTLDYNPADSFCPLTLAWDLLHPSLPNMAFCGMYRGPYMGIMDLQAQLAARAVSGSLSLEPEQWQSALETSQTIRNTNPRAQFPHFDYIGYMDTLSQLCYKEKYPKYNTNTGDVVLPSFYQENEEILQKCQSELRQEIQYGQDGSRMPKLVLQSILGKWSFERFIIHLQTNKVERVHGTVNYLKYSNMPSPSANDSFDPVVNIFSPNISENPVLYREDGLYELTPTQKFEVFREYEYECKHDALEIYFVEGGKRAHLFLSLKFVPETSAKSYDKGEYWVKATSDHLCIKDLYSATFRVKLNGLSASEIVIKYRVKGPSKDYESTTILKPQQS